MEELRKEQKLPLLPKPVENIPPKELMCATQGDSSHLMNGENSHELHPAVKKSCNSGHLTNDRIWDLGDTENCNSPGDSSNEDDINSDEEHLETGANAFSKESRLL